MASTPHSESALGLEGLSIEEHHESGLQPSSEAQGRDAALVCIIGPPGSGKSTLGKALAAAFPEDCFSLSVGEEMRRHPGTSADSIIRGALECARHLGTRYTVVDGSFRGQSLLALRELASTVLILNLEVNLDVCKENVRKRGARAGEDGVRGLDRVDQWEKSSRSTLRAAHLLGSRTLRPMVGNGSGSANETSQSRHESHTWLDAKALAQNAMITLSEMMVHVPTLDLPLPPSISSDVLSDLKKLLRVHTPTFSMPVALEDANDMAFLEMNDYMVSRKADGIRVWLFRRDSPQVFMMFRDTILKEVSIDVPPWTILDAELMESGSFLVFDILALNGQPVWFYDLKSRVAKMETLAKTLTIKQHLPLSETSALLSSQSAFKDYKVDGLVFTPNSGYMFDGSIVLFKVQAPEDITFDLDANSSNASSWDSSWVEVVDEFRFKIDVDGLDLSLFKNGGVAVCSYVSHEENSNERPPGCSLINIHVILKFQKMRYDKLVGNSPTTIRSQLKLCVFPCDISGLTPRFGGSGEGTITRSPIHPAKLFSFKDLQDLISSSPAFTTTTTPSDNNSLPASSLAVVNCRSRGADPSGLARGMVIDPTVEEVVAVSFPRFYHHEHDVNESASSTSSVHQQWSCEFCAASNATVSTTSPECCYKCKRTVSPKQVGIPSTALVRASVKLDGSMIVACMRHGVLHTNTKKRVDSQQAIWARQWLMDYAGQLEEGNSYIFEAVYKDNQIVLEYPLDSLILLAIFDVNGREIVNLDEKRSIADELRVPLAPCVFGTIDIFRSPKYLSSKEGWVVETLNEQGVWIREKLISPDWSMKSRAVHRMSPTTVWRSCGKILGVPSLFGETPFDLELLVSELPPRYRFEWELMTEQFCSAYKGAFYDIGPSHSHTLGPSDPCRVCGCSSEFDDFGDRICFCDPCRNRGGCVSDGIGNRVRRELHAFRAVRPDTSSATQVPGYEAPAFLLNNFAKSWVRRNLSGSAAHPLSRALNEDTTHCVMEFLCGSDIASFRTLSVSADEYIRNYYVLELERRHYQRVLQIEENDDFESRRAQRPRRRSFSNRFDSDDDA